MPARRGNLEARPLLLLILVLLASASGQLQAAVEPARVTLDYVLAKARERAEKPFHSPRGDLPKVLLADELNYDRYRFIQFRQGMALWSEENLPFRIEFFHPGYLYQEPVRINEFTSTHVQPIRFTQDFFDYGPLDIADKIPARTGYAGFKILYELNAPGRWDELGAFLGASYYRLLGQGQRYGQSARGLALDCGEDGRPEEFPIFTDWWLGKPEPEATTVRLYALLDSVSCVGAYEFTITPGRTTSADIQAVLLFRTEENIRRIAPDRKPLLTLGLAPLTSMFWFGKNSERKFDDYRLEVHDSDGLLARMGSGEVLWRPLNNASVLRHQKFSANNIKGFGLLQRERRFSSYLDSFNLYHQVPSVWIEPLGDWGEGDLHLVELSTEYEGLDNIVTFWDPKNKPQPMEPFRFAYRQRWMTDEEISLSENRVLSTRIGADGRNPGHRKFVIDFVGPRISTLGPYTQPVAVASCSDNGIITETLVVWNPFDEAWRVVIKMEPVADNRNPVDLRCTLEHDGRKLSETWTYHWSPP
jgi:glucans biosynthesis protein